MWTAKSSFISLCFSLIVIDMDNSNCDGLFSSALCRCLQDAELLLKVTEEISRTLKNTVSCTLIYIVASCCAHLQTSVSELKCVCYQVCINPELVRCVSRCARGCLSPLAAAVGGIASQEVLKALTGKFSPVQQWVCQSSCTLPFEGLGSIRFFKC